MEGSAELRVTDVSRPPLSSCENGQLEGPKRPPAVQAQSRPGRGNRRVSGELDRFTCEGTHRLKPRHRETGLLQGTNKRVPAPSDDFGTFPDLLFLCPFFSMTRLKSARTRKWMQATSNSFTTYSQPPWRSSGTGRRASPVSPSSARKTRSCCWNLPLWSSLSCVLHIGECSFKTLQVHLDGSSNL